MFTQNSYLDYSTFFADVSTLSDRNVGFLTRKVEYIYIFLQKARIFAGKKRMYAIFLAGGDGTPPLRGLSEVSAGL